MGTRRTEEQTERNGFQLSERFRILKATWLAMRRAITAANEEQVANHQLRRLTIHSLRHSFASILLMGGRVDMLK